jgi:hypothetical protein
MAGVSRVHVALRVRSVVEGVDAVYDAVGPTRLSVEQACLRGAREELGLELAATDITLLGFVVDMDFYQWNCR